jgi:hypothetical protein
MLKEMLGLDGGISSCFDFELVFPFLPVIFSITDRTSWLAVH